MLTTTPVLPASRMASTGVLLVCRRGLDVQVWFIITILINIILIIITTIIIHISIITRILVITIIIILTITISVIHHLFKGLFGLRGLEGLQK